MELVLREPKVPMPDGAKSKKNEITRNDETQQTTEILERFFWKNKTAEIRVALDQFTL